VPVVVVGNIRLDVIGTSFQPSHFYIVYTFRSHPAGLIEETDVDGKFASARQRRVRVRKMTGHANKFDAQKDSAKAESSELARGEISPGGITIRIGL
jgi:hypothetical protein